MSVQSPLIPPQPLCCPQLVLRASVYCVCVTYFVTFTLQHCIIIFFHISQLFRGGGQITLCATHCQSSCTGHLGKPEWSVPPLSPSPRTLCGSGWTASPPWHLCNRYSLEDILADAHLPKQSNDTHSVSGA